MQRTAVVLRYRTAWRELLHPLPVHARKMEWLKRDAVEQNEALLRRPYYTIKSYSLPAAVGQQAACTQSRGLRPSDSTDEVLRQARYVNSPEKLQELRERLQFPNAVGPQLVEAVEMTSTETGAGEEKRKHVESYTEAYGTRLRPRYPESWDTVPPHQPSREIL